MLTFAEMFHSISTMTISAYWNFNWKIQHLRLKEKLQKVLNLFAELLPSWLPSPRAPSPPPRAPSCGAPRRRASAPSLGSGACTLADSRCLHTQGQRLLAALPSRLAFPHHLRSVARFGSSSTTSSGRASWSLRCDCATAAPSLYAACACTSSPLGSSLRRMHRTAPRRTPPRPQPSPQRESGHGGSLGYSQLQGAGSLRMHPSPRGRQTLLPCSGGRDIILQNRDSRSRGRPMLPQLHGLSGPQGEDHQGSSDPADHQHPAELQHLPPTK